MPYSKLAREIRNRSGLTTESVSLVLREFVDYLLYELRQGKTVSLPGLRILLRFSSSVCLWPLWCWPFCLVKDDWQTLPGDR